jgi:hypothetical protein
VQEIAPHLRDNQMFGCRVFYCLKNLHEGASMYQITGKDDRVYRRLNALYRRRKREQNGGRWEGRKYIKSIARNVIVDEVLMRGMDAMEQSEPPAEV